MLVQADPGGAVGSARIASGPGILKRITIQSVSGCPARDFWMLDAGSWMVVFVGRKRIDLVAKESMSVS